MRRLCLVLLLPLLTLLACGDDGVPVSDGDDGRGGGSTRDVPAVDAEDEDAGPDVLIDDAFTRPDGAGDAGDAGDTGGASDAPDAEDSDLQEDTPDVGFDTPPLPDIDSSLALTVVEAARDAVEDYCSCAPCVAAGFGDEVRCRTLALRGGFELNDCKIEVIEDLGLQAEGYLRCMLAAFDEARECTPECSASECLACDSSFGRAWSACQSEFPTAYASLDACEDE